MGILLMSLLRVNQASAVPQSLPLSLVRRQLQGQPGTPSMSPFSPSNPLSLSQLHFLY